MKSPSDHSHIEGKSEMFFLWPLWLIFWKSGGTQGWSHSFYPQNRGSREISWKNSTKNSGDPNLVFLSLKISHFSSNHHETWQLCGSWEEQRVRNVLSEKSQLEVFYRPEWAKIRPFPFWSVKYPLIRKILDQILFTCLSYQNQLTPLFFSLDIV